MKVSFPDFETMCRTVYGEARGELMAGRVAVARVILNRVRIGGWWGNSVGGVCRFPMQFSCWNPGDPNLPRLSAVTADDPEMIPVVIACITAIELFDIGADPTNGATHYYVRGITPPAWSKNKIPVAEIGHHLFFSHIN